MGFRWLIHDNPRMTYDDSWWSKMTPEWPKPKMTIGWFFVTDWVRGAIFLRFYFGKLQLGCAVPILVLYSGTRWWQRLTRKAELSSILYHKWPKWRIWKEDRVGKRCVLQYYRHKSNSRYMIHELAPTLSARLSSNDHKVGLLFLPSFSAQ